MDKEEILKLIGKECYHSDYKDKGMIVGYSECIIIESNYLAIIGFYKPNSGNKNDMRWSCMNDNTDNFIIKSPMFECYCFAISDEITLIK